MSGCARGRNGSIALLWPSADYFRSSPGNRHRQGRSPFLKGANKRKLSPVSARSRLCHRGPFMDIKRAVPRPQLRVVVRSFEERLVELGSAVLTWPVAARPHQILNIHLADPYRVRIDGGPANVTPEMSLVGPQTYRRAHVYLSGTVHVFNILFQPTGLNRLVGINMTCLVNQDPAASDALGQSAITLGDAVRAAQDFRERVAAAERWVGMLLDKREPDGAID